MVILNFLFESDQFTFLGVIATLVVLSVLPSRGKEKESGENEERLSNFLVDLIRSYKRSVDNVFSERIKSLGEDINVIDDKLEQNYNSYGFESNADQNKEAKEFVGEQVRNRFANLRLEIENTHKKESEKTKSPSYIEENTPTFMSFFTFIIGVTVMTIHCLPLSFAPSPFIFKVSLLFLLDILFLVVMLSSWTYYCVDGIQKAEFDQDLVHDNKVYRFLDGVKKKVEKSKIVISDKKDASQGLVYLCVFIILIFCFLAFKLAIRIRAVILFVFIAVVSMSNYSYIRKIKREKHYDNGTIALMSIIGIVCSIIFSLVICWILSPSWLSELLDGLNGHRNRLLVIIDNLSFIQNFSQLWSNSFIFLCVLNAFIIPLFFSFVRYEVFRNMRFKHEERKWNREIEEIQEEINKWKCAEQSEVGKDNKKKKKKRMRKRKRKRKKIKQNNYICFDLML